MSVFGKKTFDYCWTFVETTVSYIVLGLEIPYECMSGFLSISKALIIVYMGRSHPADKLSAHVLFMYDTYCTTDKKMMALSLLQKIPNCYCS